MFYSMKMGGVFSFGKLGHATMCVLYENVFSYVFHCGGPLKSNQNNVGETVLLG